MRAGFADPVHESQRTFRGVLDAMAHPGRIVTIDTALVPPAPLHASTAALALTLLDFETALWVDIMVSSEARDWLRFHAGVAIVNDPAQASFAIVADARQLPSLDAFSLGTDERPERSTTVVVQVDGLEPRDGHRLTGPGIADEAWLTVRGVPQTFWRALRDNHGRFPRGVDVLLTAGDRLAALPRTTLVED
jgi:alpha-D-ribose 1-methylphosphonate 5-triphosphate synthase subunit PhnH